MKRMIYRLRQLTWSDILVSPFVALFYLLIWVGALQAVCQKWYYKLFGIRHIVQRGKFHDEVIRY